MRKLCLALLVVVVAACDDGGNMVIQDLSILVPHNFDQINDFILQPSCAGFSVCHSTQGQRDAGHLDLSKMPYEVLFGVLSDNKMAKGQGLLRVKPCDPDNSFLVMKLELPETQTDSNTGYGASMPKDNPHLDLSQIKAIRDWISRGAHQNEAVDVTGNTCMTDDAAVGDLSIID
jgi:hypothetical protein